MPTLGPTAASTADADRAALHTTASGVPNEHVSAAPTFILQLVLLNNHNIFMALQSSYGCNILHEVVKRRSPACSLT